MLSFLLAFIFLRWVYWILGIYLHFSMDCIRDTPNFWCAIRFPHAMLCILLTAIIGSITITFLLRQKPNHILLFYGFQFFVLTVWLILQYAPMVIRLAQCDKTFPQSGQPSGECITLNENSRVLVLAPLQESYFLVYALVGSIGAVLIGRKRGDEK